MVALLGINVDGVIVAGGGLVTVILLRKLVGQLPAGTLLDKRSNVP
jgi:hypothetical protein